MFGRRQAQANGGVGSPRRRETSQESPNSQAEEAFRLLQQKHGNDSQQVWARFENRTDETNCRDRTAASERTASSRCPERQASTAESKTTCGKSLSFVNEIRSWRLRCRKSLALARERRRTLRMEARTWAGICVSEKLARNGDFILAYRDSSGAPARATNADRQQRQGRCRRE